MGGKVGLGLSFAALAITPFETFTQSLPLGPFAKPVMWAGIIAEIALARTFIDVWLPRWNFRLTQLLQLTRSPERGYWRPFVTRYYKTLQFAVAAIAFAAVGLATVAVINGTIMKVMTVLFSVTMPGAYARYEAARAAAARAATGMM